ncbi:MAG: hypothetical protein NUV77_05920, partial [Thermoguttaceae bacterium]|nr:hypothetical protein [Thermoguttaceae bacterium]
QAIADEAIRRWSAAGLSAGQIDRLHSVRVLIADLPGLELGRAEGDAITLDADAAGHGWFVDPTPGDDAEFGPAADPGAAGRMDLLSAVSHELGHILGLDDVAQGTVMGSTLGTGVRRTPTDAVLTEDLDWRLI